MIIYVRLSPTLWLNSSIIHKSSFSCFCVGGDVGFTSLAVDYLDYFVWVFKELNSFSVALSLTCFFLYILNVYANVLK